MNYKASINYRVLLLQDAPLTDVNKLEATDADSNENSWISYAITEVECEKDTMKICPTDANDLFKVSGNAETVTQNVKADIKSNKPLTNKYGEYLVTVVATDHGTPSLSSEPQRYRFCINDVNNNAPVIQFPERIVVHQDNSTGQLLDDSGMEIPFILANDDDFDKNGLVKFTLEPNDVFDLTGQEGNQAKLYLKGGDLSQIEETVVTIKACDSPTGEDQLCSTQKLTIRTRFISDVEPEFAENSFDALLVENDSTVSVSLPKATDKNNDDEEEGLNQAIYYFIISGEPEDFGDYFTLGADDPVLSLKKPLDAYITDQYTLTVQTTNSPKPPFPNPASKSLLSVNITVIEFGKMWRVA